MPEVGEIFYPRTRSDWRQWLEANGQSKTEVWLRRFVKASGQPSITYDDLVEEALCYGWIDGVMKKLDSASNVQRLTPRQAKGSFLSELNRQRLWKLQAMGLVTPAGLAAVADTIGSPDDPLVIPDWIEQRLRDEAAVWDRFCRFPRSYQRLKIGWISEIRGNSRRDEAEKRLRYLIEQTARNKRYGTEPLAGTPWEF